MVGFLTAAAATLVLAASGSDAPSAPLMNLDTDNNSVVNVDELHDFVRRMIVPFDGDRDGALKAYKFHELVFHLWDSNHDLHIDLDEFRRAEEWDNGLALYDFPRLDGDGNELLGPYEFRAYQELEMYDAWDRDENRLIDQFEIADGLLMLFDENGNGVLEPGELEMVPLPVPVEQER
jgi:Ca2+-binding EF-hand superfamily protein